MSNKKIKYLILVVLVIVLAGLAYLIASNNQNKAEVNNPQTATLTPQQQAAQQAAQQAQQAQQAAQQKAAATPIYTKEVKVEFMTDAEKTAMGITLPLKIQVLERDKFGKVTAYKIIRQDSDIMNKYGN